MKEIPKDVYHGSQYLFDIVEPQKAIGQCEAESLVEDYWHTISFSEEAKTIQRELYGE